MYDKHYFILVARQGSIPFVKRPADNTHWGAANMAKELEEIHPESTVTILEYETERDELYVESVKQAWNFYRTDCECEEYNE